MKNTLIFAALALTGLAHANLLHTYQFEGNLNPTAGFYPLQFAQGQANPTIGGTPTFSSDTVGSVTKSVAEFQFDQGFLARLGMNPEAGYEYGNQYTLMFDIKFDALQDGTWASFYNTNKANGNDGEIFWQNYVGHGISSDYAGSEASPMGQYRRIVVTVNLFRAGTTVDPRMNVYVDGTLVNQVNLGSGLDGRWALYTDKLIVGDEFRGTYLLMDESGESAQGKISQFAFWDEELAPAFVATLGGPGPKVGPDAVMATSIAVIEGEDFGGSVSDIQTSDEVAYQAFNDATTLAAQVEIGGTVATAPTTTLNFLVETRVDRLGLSETVSFYNFATSQWQAKSGRVATGEDSTSRTSAGANPASYVSNAGQVLARIKWAPINDEDPSQDGWLHSIDLAKWESL